MSGREQRAAIRFCVLLGKSGSETFELIKNVYVTQTMSRTRVFE